jgi:hypothetical protein
MISSAHNALNIIKTIRHCGTAQLDGSSAETIAASARPMMSSALTNVHKHATDGERETETWGGSEGEGGQSNFPALKVPRQCPLILLVEVRFREGSVLRSEKDRYVDCVMSSGFAVSILEDDCIRLKP